MSYVELIGLTKAFGSKLAVDDLSLEIEKGEFIVLLGPSGCGKTTTLRLVAGLIRPDKGEVRVGGRILSNPSIFVPPEKRGMGMVHQSFAVWPHMTVFNNVAYGLKIRKLPKEEIKRRVMQVLEMTKLNGLEDRYPSQLSGGQQQRVALARAIVTEPEILLFDEPLSNLDAKLREEMRFELKELQRRLGITSIYVTHDQAEAMVVGDRIAVMNDGKLVQMGTPWEVYYRPKDVFTASFIGLANFLEGKVVDRMVDCVRVRLRDGSMLEAQASHQIGVGSDVLISIRPHHIGIHAKPVEGHRLLEGRVIKSIFLGDKMEYQVEVAGQLLRVHSSDALELEGDGHVFVSFDPYKCVTIPKPKA